MPYFCQHERDARAHIPAADPASMQLSVAKCVISYRESRYVNPFKSTSTVPHVLLTESEPHADQDKFRHQVIRNHAERHVPEPPGVSDGSSDCRRSGGARACGAVRGCA